MKVSKLARSVTSSGRPIGPGAELLRRALGERSIDVADRYPRALRDQRGRRGAADPAGAACDCDDLAGQRSWGFRHENLSS